MKSYNHLFEKIIDEDNIKLAIHEAAKKKKKRKDVQNVLNNIEYHIKKIKYILENNLFKPRKHIPKIIDDGFAHKKREIVQPDFIYEQIIHHCVMQVLIPIFSKSLYKYTCGSIPNRGNAYGKKYIEKWIKEDISNTKYVGKLDIKKFFKNVNLEKLKYKLAKIIHDIKALNLIYIIIDSYDDGLPLGFFTSQWFANFFLQDLDYYIKQEIGIKYYVRYMDDMVLFANSKEKLHNAIYLIQQYLKNILDLELKSNYQVFRLANNKNDNARPLNFMGYLFYGEKTIIRKNIMLKGTRKISKIKKKGKCTWYDATQLMSNYGWIKHTNTYTMFNKYYTQNGIYISDLKYKISRHQKMLNQQLKVGVINDIG